MTLSVKTLVRSLVCLIVLSAVYTGAYAFLLARHERVVQHAALQKVMFFALVGAGNTGALETGMQMFDRVRRLEVQAAPRFMDFLWQTPETATPNARILEDWVGRFFASCEDAVCQDLSLRGLNIQGINLSGARLAQADLSGSDFQGADLSGANLSEADLRGANLTGARLVGTRLRYANFLDAQINAG